MTPRSSMRWANPPRPARIPGRSGRGVGVGLAGEDVGDALAERLGDLVLALAGDHLTQLRLEVELLEAGRTVVEVAADVGPPVVRELAVKEGVELEDGVVAVSMVIHAGYPSRIAMLTHPCGPCWC